MLYKLIPGNDVSPLTRRYKGLFQVSAHSFKTEGEIMDIQKSVRDFLRAADIVIAHLRNGGPLSEQEMTLLQAYNARIECFVRDRQRLPCTTMDWADVDS